MLAIAHGEDAMNSAETNLKERDLLSRVRENRLHGLTRGRAALAGDPSLLSLVYNQNDGQNSLEIRGQSTWERGRFQAKREGRRPVRFQGMRPVAIVD